MVPACVTCGATKATVSRAWIRLPAICVMAPAPPGTLLNLYWPFMKSPSDMFSVDATSEPTSALKPLPKTMPLGFRKNTRPLVCRLPSR